MTRFQTYRNIIALGRKSPAWTSIICDVTQRLRFQGDNVLRIRVRVQMFVLWLFCR